MTVSFRKSFIGNEGKKRAKAIWLATEIDMTQRIYIYGGGKTRRRKVREKQMKAVRRGMESKVHLHFLLAAAKLILPFLISTIAQGSIDSQSSGRMDLGCYRVEYRYVRQTNSSSYLAHITRVVLLRLCVCVRVWECRHIFCFQAGRFSISFFSGTHIYIYTHTHSWAERHIITHRRISPWSAFLWFDKSVRST